MNLYFINISLEKNEDNQYNFKENVIEREVVSNDSFYISYKKSDAADEDAALIEHRELEFLSTDFQEHVGYYLQFITLDGTIVHDMKKEMKKTLKASIIDKITPLSLMLKAIPDENKI